MNEADFERWLTAYGQAWTAADPEAATQLFSRDASYFETPFDPPMIGAAAIHRYWTEGAKNSQANVTFRATVIAVTGAICYALWSASFRRVPSGAHVELDGVLRATFNDQMRCTEFREWWHRRER